MQPPYPAVGQYSPQHRTTFKGMASCYLDWLMNESLNRHHIASCTGAEPPTCNQRCILWAHVHLQGVGSVSHTLAVAVGVDLIAAWVKLPHSPRSRQGLEQALKDGTQLSADGVK